jgi:hypothetical protein
LRIQTLIANSFHPFAQKTIIIQALKGSHSAMNCTLRVSQEFYVIVKKNAYRLKYDFREVKNNVTSGFLGNITSASCCATVGWRGIVAIPRQRNNENKRFHATMKTNVSTQQ